MNTELELLLPAQAKAAATELAVPENRALELFKPFAEPFKAALELLDQEASATSAKDARALRLKMVKARTAIKGVKDSEKEDAKTTARIVDYYHNKSTEKLSEAEARLRAIEEAEERAEEAKRRALSDSRSTELSALGVDPQFYSLGTMPEEGYAQLLTSCKAAAEMKKVSEARAAEEARIAAEKAETERVEAARVAAVEAARKEAERQAALAEAQRLAAEAAQQAKIEREAREKAEAEADRLAAEVKAREEAAAAERKRLEDEARAEQLRRDTEIIAERKRLKAEANAREAEERKAREAAQAEAKRLRDEEAARIAAEAKAKAEAEEAKRKAAQAPDKDKLLTFADAVEALVVPDVSTEAAQAVRAEIAAKVGNFARWIRNQSQAL